MADIATDLYTFFGPTLRHGGTAEITTLQSLLGKHNVLGAVTLSTRAVRYDAVSGNAETRAICATGDGTLLPGAVLDPRIANPETCIDPDTRIIFLFPATQNWSLPYAPLDGNLRVLIQTNRARPLWWECAKPGDATRIVHLLEEVEYPAAVVLGSVSAVNLHEALTVAQRSPRLMLCTDALAGIGEISLAVKTLGGERVLFGSGAPERSLGSALALIRTAGLDDTTSTQVLSGNVRNLLRRTPPGGTAK